MAPAFSSKKVFAPCPLSRPRFPKSFPSIKDALLTRGRGRLRNQDIDRYFSWNYVVKPGHMGRDGSNNPDLGLTMPRTKTNEIKIKKTSVIAKAIPNDLLWNIQARLGDCRVTRHGFDVTFLAMNRKKQLSLHSLLSRMPVVTGYPRDPLASFSRKIYARYSRTTYEIGGDR